MDYSDLKYDMEEFESDQDKKLPQPPLVKDAMRTESIELPKNFDALSICSNFLDIINTRHSSRVYTQEPMSLLELSYMLWTRCETNSWEEICDLAYCTFWRS